MYNVGIADWRLCTIESLIYGKSWIPILYIHICNMTVGKDVVAMSLALEENIFLIYPYDCIHRDRPKATIWA